MTLLALSGSMTFLIAVAVVWVVAFVYFANDGSRSPGEAAGNALGVALVAAFLLARAACGTMPQDLY